MAAESHEQLADASTNDDHNAIPRQSDGTARTDDLRQLDAHASYQEVYHACHVYGVGHE